MNLPETIQQVDTLFQKWKDLQPLSKDAADKLWQKLRLEWNFNSNHIEGNTLTYGETKLLLMFDKTTGDHVLREYEEMKAHDLAVHLIKEWAADSERELTEADIRELNKVILVKPFWKEALTPDGHNTRRLIDIGTYKKHPNHVRTATGEIFHYAPPEETPQRMADLLEWYRKNQDLHPAVLAAEMHYRFIRIHPFDDGNGRIARLLVNYILMRNDYPPTVIKSENKKAYLTALQKADAGDREAFQTYMAEQVIWSLQLGIRAGEGKSVEEEDDLDKEITLLKRNQKSEIEEKKKEKNLMHNALGDAFIPLLEEVYQHFLKFNELFDAGSWYYFDSPNAVNSELTNSNLIQLSEVLRNQLERSSAKRLFVIYRLEKFLKERSFNLEVGLKIVFSENGYQIEVFVGSPNQTFQSAVLNAGFLGKSVPGENNRLFKLAEVDYDTKVYLGDVMEWAKRVAREVLNMIKAHTK